MQNAVPSSNNPTSAISERNRQLSAEIIQMIVNLEERDRRVPKDISPKNLLPSRHHVELNAARRRNEQSSSDISQNQKKTPIKSQRMFIHN